MRELGYYTAYKGKWHLTEKLEKPLPDEKDEDIDVGDIPEPELHKIMEKYGFADYHGIGDIIGHSKGGYFYDSTTTAQTINWLRCKGQPLNDQHKPGSRPLTSLILMTSCLLIPIKRRKGTVAWRVGSG